MFLNNLKEKLSSSIKRFSGRKDFLEAVCAASALVAAADGEITDDEIKMAIKVVSSNPTLAAAFKTSEIEKCIDSMLKRAGSGRTGRMGLYKEIEDIAKDPAMCETTYLCALDIAETDGNVAKEEKLVLDQIAKRLGVNQQAMQV